VVTFYPSMVEEHVILRIPDTLREQFDREIEELGHPDCEFDFTDSENITLRYKGTKYKASLIPLPCILEAQKTFDGNQFYKINDVANMLVVWPKNYTEVEINHYTKIYAASGITPPLKFVKYRRWRERAQSLSAVEEVEKKVKELLERDKLATSVRIQTINADNEEEDVSSLAAELEHNLLDEYLVDQKQFEEVAVESEMVRELKRQIAEIQEKIKEKKEFLKSATNIIVQRRFEEAIKNLSTELDEIRTKLNSQDTRCNTN
ncbi:Transcription initiation factor TFIID, subunit TAF7, partial [Trachipleistophora hominis]